MLKILIKHCIYEICLEVIFSNAHANFQKPIPEKKQVIGKMIANLLFTAERIHKNTKYGDINFIIGHSHIVDEVDKNIIESMKQEVKNDITTR